MTHSIPEPMRSPSARRSARFIHTGDWKIDPAPAGIGPMRRSPLPRLGEEGVLAMMCDSTNAMREGVSPSEKDVARESRSR